MPLFYLANLCIKDSPESLHTSLVKMFHEKPFEIEIKELAVNVDEYLSTSMPSISIHERMVALQLSRGDMRPLGMNSLMDLVIVDVR